MTAANLVMLNKDFPPFTGTLVPVLFQGRIAAPAILDNVDVVFVEYFENVENPLLHKEQRMSIRWHQLVGVCVDEAAAVALRR
jgi:hypothetical protein